MSSVSDSSVWRFCGNVRLRLYVRVLSIVKLHCVIFALSHGAWRTIGIIDVVQLETSSVGATDTSGCSPVPDTLSVTEIVVSKVTLFAKLYK